MDKRIGAQLYTVRDLCKTKEDFENTMKRLAEIGFKGQIVSEPFVMMGGEVGTAIHTWRNLVSDTTEAGLDKEAKALLDFERNMILKYAG